VTAEIVEQVRLLDGLVRYRFGDTAELMGAWESARNVLGPFRSKVEPQAGEGQTQTPALFPSSLTTSSSAVVIPTLRSTRGIWFPRAASAPERRSAFAARDTSVVAPWDPSRR